MTQQGAVPKDFFEVIRKIAREEAAKSYRSGANRNSSIGSGGTFVIQGGRLQLIADDGHTIFYVGPLGQRQQDGSDQQGFELIRADGSVVLAMYDAQPGQTVRQALNWYDRTGNPVIADDTNGGVGLARPWLPMPLPVSTDITSWPKTSATTWTEVARSLPYEQHPVIVWQGDAYSAGTAEVQLQITDLSSNVLLSSPVHTVAAGTTIAFADQLTLPAGFWSQNRVYSVMARMTGGTGPVYVQTFSLYGRQT